MLLCSAVLIAPSLVLTARHCVAALAEGPVSCTPEGELAPDSQGGALGSDDAPSTIKFYTNARVVAGTEFSDPPDAVGAQILSTHAPSVCRDDLAFVVLDRPLTGITPAPVRLTNATEPGEPVAVWGYGLTDDASDREALRVRNDATVAAVGPSTPTSTTQAAPLRAITLAPTDLSCNGDSGGPITSSATGAVIGLVSAGAYNPGLLYCPKGAGSTTSGPRLAEYASLAAKAFQAAGSQPILEPGDAGAADAEGGAGADEAGAPDGAADPPLAASGGCAMTRGDGSYGWAPGGVAGLALAATAAAVGRRRR